MCQVPVFCWITATVLEDMLTTEQREELPKTLTDLYTHFLLVQTERKKLKYEGQEMELTETDMEKTVYCFVHLSVQEFLAAVYMYHCYTNSNTKVLETFLRDDTRRSLDDFLMRAMKKSMESKNGHL
ncbi:hypothetical protein LDENG_00023910, partial [Lucifuga dentata]